MLFSSAFLYSYFSSKKILLKYELKKSDFFSFFLIPLLRLSYIYCIYAYVATTDGNIHYFSVCGENLKMEKNVPTLFFLVAYLIIETKKRIIKSERACMLINSNPVWHAGAIFVLVPFKTRFGLPYLAIAPKKEQCKW